MTPPADALTLSRIADELAAMRQGLERLTTENVELRTRLDASEQARADLQTQTEHLLDLLAESRQQLRDIWAQQKKDAQP